MVIKNPWERRLKDLSIILNNCYDKYFDPELFRMFVNQFLQTSRTVTFIIQKNKKDIPDYDNWYQHNVLNEWKNDPLMTWAKNSRNIVEKQGDLDMYSKAKSKLIFSHLEEEDINYIEDDRLLNIRVKRLIRLAQKKIPSDILDSASIQTERIWITKSFSSIELTQALSLVYSRVYSCCQKLAIHLGSTISEDIPTPIKIDLNRDGVKQVEFIKLSDLKKYRLNYSTVFSNYSVIPPTLINKIQLINEQSKVSSLSEAVEKYSKLAENVFHEYGNHFSMLFFLDNHFDSIDFLSVDFTDQADKFIFWRMVAEKTKVLNAHAIIFISEFWVRKLKNNNFTSSSQTPIIGEKLEVYGLDMNNNKIVSTWDIIRESGVDKPTLENHSTYFDIDNSRNFIIPVLRAMDIL